MSMTPDVAVHVMREELRASVKRHSGWYLGQAILMIVAGIFALVHPLISSLAVVTILGWLLIISGALQAISLIGAQNLPQFWLQPISTVLFIIVGLLFVRNPAESVLTLTLLLIVFFLVEGVSKVILSLTVRPLPNWGWILASGILAILLSLYLWGSLPATSVWLLGMFLGIELIAEGFALGSLAWGARKS